MSGIERVWSWIRGRRRGKTVGRRTPATGAATPPAFSDLRAALAALRTWGPRAAERARGGRADPGLVARLACASEATARRIEALDASLRDGDPRSRADGAWDALARDLAELALDRRPEPRVLH
jgi:hypothetical protein